ncbi:hypothetical protein RUND412_008947 [Rhizina undulata]
MVTATITQRKSLATTSRTVNIQSASRFLASTSRWSRPTEGYSRWSSTRSRATAMTPDRLNASQWQDGNTPGKLYGRRRTHFSTARNQKMVELEGQQRKRKVQSLNDLSTQSIKVGAVVSKKRRIQPPRASTSGLSRAPEAKEKRSEVRAPVLFCDSEPLFLGLPSPDESLQPIQAVSPANLQEEPRRLRSHSSVEKPAAESNQKRNLRASTASSSRITAKLADTSDRSFSVLSRRLESNQPLKTVQTEEEQAPKYATRRSSARLVKCAEARLLSPMEPNDQIRTRSSTNQVKASTTFTTEPAGSKTNPVVNQRTFTKPQGRKRKRATKLSLKRPYSDDEIYESITCVPVPAAPSLPVPAKPPTPPTTTRSAAPSTGSTSDEIESALSLLTLRSTVPSLRYVSKPISRPQFLSGDPDVEYTDQDMRILYNRFGPDILRAKMAPYDEYERINPIDAADPWAFCEEWVDKWIPMKPEENGARAAPVGEREVLGGRWPSWLYVDGGATYFI